MAWTREKLIKKYVDFFKSKNHKEIQNSPLIPQNDPTVLFTTAGMHPLVPFLLGQKHPQGKRLVNVQKCIRTGDIDEVGDEHHLTFFEMLGNWSLGDYWKSDAIAFTLEFLTKKLKIPIEMLAVSCFIGDKDAPRDEESAKIWESLGIKKERIAFLEKADNWWDSPGKTGPCGPDTEIFYWVGQGSPKGNPKTHKKDWREIGNNVLMQYYKNESGKFEAAKQKNIDFGGGVERILTVLQNKESVFETELFLPILQEIEKISKKKYEEYKKDFRIIADHIKASIFILNEKMQPSNTEQGYVLRRLIRRAVRYGKNLMIQNNFTSRLAQVVIKIYPDYNFNKEFILQELEKEETRFRETLASGLRYFASISEKAKGKIEGKDTFLLYQSYGFPVEMTQELAKEKKLEVDMLGYEQAASQHRELSRTAAQGRFKSGLADHSEKTTRLHTAAHLLLAALRQVLKRDIEQRGSNITAERLRFDFSFDRKLDEKEVKEIEKIINSNISKKLQVKREEMSVKEAKAAGAMGIFDDKYGEKVSVYTVCSGSGHVSKEICAGPHVTNLSELGKFRIKEQESVGAGVRRVKAELLNETN